MDIQQHRWAYTRLRSIRTAGAKKEYKDMRILHFSDFHMQSGSKIARSQKLLQRMLEMLKEINRETKIDLIVFSGDMIDRGGEGFTSLDLAFGNFKNLIIDTMLSELNLTADRFVFAPGNHDVNQKADSKRTEMGTEASLTTIAEIDDFIREPDSVEDVKRIKYFKTFQQSYYEGLSNIDYYHNPYQSNLVINIEGKKVGITILNSVWRCYNSKTDKGKILLGQAQIIDSEQYIKKCDIKIAVSHHDYNWFNAIEMPGIPKLIAKNYNMFFCGHTHGADAELISRPEGNTFYFTAPGLLHANIQELNGDYKNGFMVIDYTLDCHKVSAYKYLQFTDESFNLDKNYADNGVWVRDIPIGEVALRNEMILDVYNKVQNNVITYDSHLLGYRTQTLAPKNIDDIFVMPNLIYKEQDSNDLELVKDVNVASIEDLLEIEGNIMLCGGKSSGKTILLDKITIELLRNYRNKDIIPVRINYHSINKGNILQLIGMAWDESSKHVKEVINEKQVVLLIDNVEFNERSNDAIEELNRFLTTYSSIRLIATTNRNSLTFTDSSKQSFQYKNILIKSFQTEQIRSLAGKWNGVPEDHDSLREKIDFIINTFSTFKLPCTPFSVTLLLWILEKGGQCQPTNSAILMETFLLEVLKDCGKGFGKEKFNQFNKVRLLASIAHSMLDEEANSIKENRGYHFTYGNLEILVEKHLEEMELTAFGSGNIIKELTEAGILVREQNNLVYFRFRCFMEFFLAKEMQLSREFFDMVMSEDNYLYFTSEIGYYTGLTSDKVSVLNNIISRLEIEYLSLQDLLEKVPNIDDIFIRKSLLEDMNNDDLNLLTPSKHTVEEDNRRSNVALADSESKVKGGEVRKSHISSYRKYAELMMLAMDVLKNTEETQETGFKMVMHDYEKRTKKECFKIVLENSVRYAAITYIMCMKFIRDYHNDASQKEKIQEMSFVMFLLPLLHEELLRDHLGSIKLEDPIKDMINLNKVSGSSEFLQFITVFLYSDLKCKNYIKEIKEFINSYKRSFISDSTYIKLKQYYYNSNDKKLDEELLDLMASIYIKSHKSNTGQKLNKGALIQQMKLGKR